MAIFRAPGEAIFQPEDHGHRGVGVLNGHYRVEDPEGGVRADSAPGPGGPLGTSRSARPKDHLGQARIPGTDGSARIRKVGVLRAASKVEVTPSKRRSERRSVEGHRTPSMGIGHSAAESDRMRCRVRPSIRMYADANGSGSSTANAC